MGGIEGEAAEGLKISPVAPSHSYVLLHSRLSEVGFLVDALFQLHRKQTVALLLMWGGATHVYHP